MKQINEYQIQEIGSTCQSEMKEWASSEKWDGSVGGSSSMIAFNWANILSFSYGYFPPATSTRERPSDQTSEETL